MYSKNGQNNINRVTCNDVTVKRGKMDKLDPKLSKIIVESTHNDVMEAMAAEDAKERLKRELGLKMKRG